MLENIFDYLRFALYALLILCCFLIFQAWDKDHPKPELPAEAVETSQHLPGNYVPTATTASEAAPAEKPAMAAPARVKGQIVKVTTDLLDVSIDTRGGDIISASLLNYPENLGSKQPFLLLNDDPKTQYLAESGLLGKMGPDTRQAQALYTAAALAYVLSPDQNTLDVKLDWQNDQGLKVSKIYTFTRNSYEIAVRYEVDNQSSQPFEGNLYTQLLRANAPPANHGGFINLATYFGAAISSPEKHFSKIDFKEMKKENFDKTFQGGWAAMMQHYFISAWIPEPNATSTYYSRVTPNELYTIGMIGQPLKAAPFAKARTSAKLYVGPAIKDNLEKAAPNLQLTIDYGWFWFISGIIFWMMQKIYDVIGNWGWAIVLVTVIIKILFYQLSAKSFRSMAAMKKLQPKIETLKERYKNDKQKMTQATLELYRQEKVNPMSGCLPILIQIPVFIALYWVLVESVQLRQAPFILWIHDLSQQDPYYVLPLLMGASMFLQQRLNPPPPDPMQAKIMMMMPVVFTIMFAKFPAGLMLYWFVNNTLSFLQQWYVMRKMETVSLVKKK